MTVHIVYQTDDGQIFKNANDAAQHDVKYDSVGQSVENALSPLGNKVERGVRRHALSDVKNVKIKLIDIARQFYPFQLKWFDVTIDNFKSGAYLAENTDLPLRKAWYRLNCIDDNGDEYSQMFYTIGFADDKDRARELAEPLQLSDNKI